MNKRVRDSVGFVVSLALVIFVAAVGGASTSPGAWYEGLSKPSWTPPALIFGPVWSVLYLSMAIAAWLVWMRRTQARVHMPLVLYGVQLMLNALWSWIFFAWHSIGLAFMELGILLACIIVTMLLFWRIRPLAGMLLIPYALWCSFAAVLNGVLWRLNS